MKKLLICLVLLACFTSVNAGSSTWDGSDGYWMDGHWSGDNDYLIPGWVDGNPNNDGTWSYKSNKSYAYIENGTARITSDSVPDGRVERLYVNGGSLITSADYSAYKYYISDEGTTGTVTQTDGSVTVNKMYISEDGGSAVYDISGGSLAISDDAYIGNGGSAIFNQTGGTVNVTAGTLYVGFNGVGQTTDLILSDGSFGAVRIKAGSNNDSGSRGTGNITISGGTFDVSNYLSMYSGSNSAFTVSGSEATNISIAQFSIYDETLAIELDSEGSTLINVFGTSDDSYKGASITGGTFAIDTLADFDGVIGDVYDILWSATTIDTTDLEIVSLGDVDFSYAVVDAVDGGQTLQVTVVPEPAAITLMMVGGWFLKRRKCI